LSFNILPSAPRHRRRQDAGAPAALWLLSLEAGLQGAL